MHFNYFDTMLRARKGYSRVLEPVCREWDLTRNELDVILFLANNPERDRAVDIVNGRGMSKSHVSLSVANLEERGFLVRRADRRDQRNVHLVLTEKAMTAARAGQEAQRDFFGRIYGDLSQEEMDAFFRITMKICGNIDKLEEM